MWGLSRTNRRLSTKSTVKEALRLGRKDLSTLRGQDTRSHLLNKLQVTLRYSWLYYGLNHRRVTSRVITHVSSTWPLPDSLLDLKYLSWCLIPPGFLGRRLFTEVLVFPRNPHPLLFPTSSTRWTPRPRNPSSVPSPHCQGSGVIIQTTYLLERSLDLILSVYPQGKFSLPRVHPIREESFRSLLSHVIHRHRNTWVHST